MKHYWVSCKKFTVGVETDDQHVITDAAPIVRRFIGQHMRNLVKWARKLGGLRVYDYDAKKYWYHDD